MCALSVLQKECRKVWGARYTLGARYWSENTVLSIDSVCTKKHTHTHIQVKVTVIPQQAEMDQGVPGRFRHKGGRWSALCTGRLFPRKNPWYSFSEAESTPGHMVLSEAMEKIPSDTTGNRSWDLPTSSAVP